jgi:hypothetical protein
MNEFSSRRLIVGGKTSDVILSVYWKKLELIDVTPVGKVNDVNALPFSKQKAPIYVTESGMTYDLIKYVLAKAPPPILFKLLEKVNEVTLRQFENALSPMDVIFDGIVISVSDKQK